VAEVVVEADLTRFVVEVIQRAAFDEDAAQRSAVVFVEADLRGVHSHGLNDLPDRLSAVDKRLIDPNARPTLVTEFGAAALFEGHQGFGPVLCSTVIETAVDIASRYGIAFVSLGNSSHWGCPAQYARWIARHGCIGIAMTNTNPAMPLHGSDRKSATNAPYTVAAPKAGGEPVVLGISFQQISWNRLKLAAQAGEKLPGAWGYDASGQETDNPTAIIESGRIRPIGDFKGSGFAFMQEILTGVIGLGMTSAQIGEMTAKGETGHYSQSFMVTKADLFGSLEDFDTRINALYKTAKSASPAPSFDAVNLPGDRSNGLLLERRANGLPIAPILISLERLSSRYQVPLPRRH
jgi:LDH2 family malate/lactate/ureidoglycolate dehydrogenase